MLFHDPINIYPYMISLVSLRKPISRVSPFVLTLNMLMSAVCPASHLLCIVITFVTCTLISRKVPVWVSLLLLLLSNDIEVNPGPDSGPGLSYHKNFFTFMNWNLNSLSKDNFQRVQAIEAHNTLFNYDLISICETSLNDSIEIPDPLLNNYTFIPANHPDNVAHGGVGLFYKNTLPIKHRDDLSFDESIVVELKFGRKKIFFTVLYRTPSVKANSPGFTEFLNNFKSLHLDIQSENPYAIFYTGDFNGHSKFWWAKGDTTPEGKGIEELFSSLSLSQLISEPTNFTPNKSPSCIDLLVTDQPNLILDSGTRPSLDPKCHHQIVYGKINLKIPPPPPTERKIWHYDKANTNAIRNSMNNFPWAQHLRLNSNPNWQTKQFTEIFLNIMANFIPNEIKKSVPRDPPWIDKNLKLLLKKKDKHYRNYKKHGYREEDKVTLEALRTECKESIDAAKKAYLEKLANTLNDSNTTPKSYWKILYRVMNKSRAPKIPPILDKDTFIISCKEKAKIFNEFFAKQCTLIINDSSLPDFHYNTGARIDSIVIKKEDILSLVRNLNPNKATGSDEISGNMLQICDESVIVPLFIIFHNILESSTYPDQWKQANVVPIHKKKTSSWLKIIDRYLFYHYVGKFSRNLSLTAFSRI